jgi:hypothetical protein
MSEFLQQIKSPGWWLGVVVVGILINLVSASCNHWLHRFLSSSSARWRELSEMEKATQEELVSKVTSDPHLQILLGIEINRRLTTAIGICLLAMFAFSVGFVLKVGESLLVASKAPNRLEYIPEAALLVATVLGIVAFEFIRDRRLSRAWNESKIRREAQAETGRPTRKRGKKITPAQPVEALPERTGLQPPD